MQQRHHVAAQRLPTILNADAVLDFGIVGAGACGEDMRTVGSFFRDYLLGLHHHVDGLWIEQPDQVSYSRPQNTNAGRAYWAYNVAERHPGLPYVYYYYFDPEMADEHSIIFMYDQEGAAWPGRQSAARRHSTLSTDRESSQPHGVVQW